MDCILRVVEELCCTHAGKVMVQCDRCERKFGPFKARKVPRITCILGHKSSTMQSTVERAKTFMSSYVNQAINGFACSKEQIEKRFNKCKGCEAFNQESKDNQDAGLCLTCGCFVNKLHASEGLNKLAWSNEECPYVDIDGKAHPKWRKIERQ